MKLHMKHRITKIHISLVYILLIIPFLKPYCISVVYSGSLIDTIFDFLVVLSTLICLAGTFLYRIKLNFITKWVLLFEILMLICAKPDYRFDRVSTTISTFGVIICVTILLNRDPKRTIDSFFVTLLIFLLINFVTLLIYPMGLNNVILEDERVYFLGVPNVISYYVLLLMIVSFIRDKALKDLSTIFALFVCGINIVAFHSSTGIVACIIMFIGYICNMRQIQWLTFKRAVIVAFIFEVVFVIVGGQELFSVFIVNILNKQTTFTGRTIIWSGALEIIRDNLIWGIGEPSFELLAWYGRETYCHNAFLDIALKGGLVSLVAFVMIFVELNKKIVKEKSFSVERVFAASILGYLIIGLMEGLEDRMGFWICLAFVSCSEIIGRTFLREKL